MLISRESSLVLISYLETCHFQSHDACSDAPTALCPVPLPVPTAVSANGHAASCADGSATSDTKGHAASCADGRATSDTKGRAASCADGRATSSANDPAASCACAGDPFFNISPADD